MAADIKLSDCYIAPYSQPCWDCMNACGGCSWSAKGEPVPRLEGGTGYHPEPPGPWPGKFLSQIFQNLFLPSVPGRPKEGAWQGL
jgi:hypothetical protein